MALENQQKMTVEEYFLACLGVHFPVMAAYEGINPDEDFSSEEGK